MGDQPQPAVNFEQDLDDLEKVVKQLESGDLPLEKSLELFERGVALSESCRKQLEAAETRVEILLNKGGEPLPEPFDGMVLCNASSIVAPWQGREPRWGTNPICVSVPGSGWLLDMATTTVAMGRIYKAGIDHEPKIPPGWAMDSDGVPTTSTEAALQGLLMPLGGYKGSGLAMMVEMLTGVLSAGAIGTELGGLRVKSQPFRVSQFFLAIDVARLMPLDEFRERMSKLVELAKSSRPARGQTEVLVAGEPEWRNQARRQAEGIPVSGHLWQQLAQIAGRLGVAWA